MDTITLKVDYYKGMQKKIKELSKENNDLKEIIDVGKISNTAQEIESLRSEIAQKGSFVFLNLALYPIGKEERNALIKLLDDLSIFICEGKKILEEQ